MAKAMPPTSKERPVEGPLGEIKEAQPESWPPLLEEKAKLNFTLYCIYYCGNNPTTGR